MTSIAPYILVKCPECQVSKAVLCDASTQDLIINKDDVMLKFNTPRVCETCKKEVLIWVYLGIAPDPYPNNNKGAM